jgi:hypothetical protein
MRTIFDSFPAQVLAKLLRIVDLYDRTAVCGSDRRSTAAKRSWRLSRRAGVIALLLVASITLMGHVAAAVEYQINFIDGSDLRTSRVRQVGDAIQYEKFGGEASVSVDEVASVFVLESDGTVSWVMQPRRQGEPPRARPASPPKERVDQAKSASASAADAVPSAAPQAVVAPAGSVAAEEMSQPSESATDGTGGQSPAAVPAVSAVTVPTDGARAALSATDDAPPRSRQGKVILKPATPLTERLLRWAAAPVMALLALGVVLVVFRRKFRAGEQGVPVTGSVGDGGQHEVDFSLPAKCWETLVSSIEERDIQVYRLCWQQSYSDEDLDAAFQKILTNWKYYDYSVVEGEPHPSSKERFYLHIKRSTKFAREDLEERVRRLSLLLTDGGWKFEELPYGF